MDPMQAEQDIPAPVNPDGEFATMKDPRPATAADLQGLGRERRTILPPEGVIAVATTHPISKMPSWACVLLPSEYRSRGWTFYDTALIEGDIRFGTTERALMIKRTNHKVGTVLLWRQAWIFAVTNLTREGDYLKNSYVRQIIRDANYPPKERARAVKSLAMAADRALHDMRFWDTEIASLQKRKRWEIDANIEQTVEKYSPSGNLEFKKVEVI